MGLLDKVDAGRAGAGGASDSGDIRAVIADFCRENPLFHCIVFKHDGGEGRLSRKISDMTGCHGVACRDLSGRNCMVLLPGELDMELFSHRISNSTGASVLFQFSADAPVTAFDALHSYLP